MNGYNLIKKKPVLWLTMVAVLMAMNVVLSSFSIPVPGGHLYLNDIVICTAAILLDPLGAFIVGGVGAFLGDFFFYPAPMFVSLASHGLEAVVVSLCAHNLFKEKKALGAGIGEEFDLAKLRYHKVVIMADADVDGAHIRTLLLTFFFRFMRPLIEQGYVYSAVPPLYKLTRGKTTRVAFSDEERDQISAEMRGGNPNVKIDISRFKGLGEMNPHELWETTMDPEKRTLRRITLDDAVQADETFTILMGEKVEPRKEFIEKRAQYAVNLDY